MQKEDNFRRGTAEMLILHLLQNEDLYGYQITQTFKEKSNGTYNLLEGSLYNILFKMTEKGYISNRLERVGVKRTRRYYHLEEKGRLYYNQLLNEYDRVCESVSRILDREGDADRYALRVRERNQKIS